MVHLGELKSSATVILPTYPRGKIEKYGLSVQPATLYGEVTGLRWVRLNFSKDIYAGEADIFCSQSLYGLVFKKNLRTGKKAYSLILSLVNMSLHVASFMVKVFVFPPPPISMRHISAKY